LTNPPATASFPRVQGKSGQSGRLIVEPLGDERLVYDTELGEAHRLGPAAALEFDSAADDISRRQVLRKLALAGAAASSLPLIKTIAAPTPAQAQSGVVCAGAPGGTCLPGFICCGGTTCVPSSFTCCGSGSCPASFTCCPGSPATCCPPTFTCGSPACTAV
jgi:hypothetical protein